MKDIDCDTATAPEMAGAIVEYIEEHGWIQGRLQSADGEVCLVGAIGGVCAGDPRQGYGVCAGYRLTSTSTGLIEGLPVPKGLLALAKALTQEGTIRIRTWTGMVEDAALTFFNDQNSATVDDVLAPFRRIAGFTNAEEVVDA